MKGSKSIHPQPLIKTLVKATVALISLTVFYYIKEKDIYFQIDHSDYYDVILEDYLKSFTDYITQNLYIRDIIVTLGALTLDTMFVLFAFLFIFHGKGFPEFVTLGMFYGFRGFLLNIFNITVMENFVGDNPFFFSISTPYGRGNDYFYSGHTGCALILAIIFLQYNHKVLFVYGMFVTLLQGYVMMITRQHLFIDIIVAFCLAHYFRLLSNKLGRGIHWLFPSANRQYLEL